MLDLNMVKLAKMACPLAISVGLSCVAASQEPSVDLADESQKFSYEQVQGIFKQHCVACHNEDQPRAELVMTSIDGILIGSSSGPVVVAGDPSASPLYLLAAHLESPAMPPNKPKIPQRELNKIRDWIMTGLGDFKRAADPKTMDPSPTDPMQTASNSGSMIPVQAVSQHHRVAQVACSPDGQKIAIQGNSQICFWDVQTHSMEPQAIRIEDSEISGLEYSIDGKYLWCSIGKPGESGVVRRWNFQKQSFDWSMPQEDDTIQDFCVAPSGDSLAIGTSTRLVKDFGLQKSVSHEFKKHTDWVTRTAYSSDELLLASGDRFGAILLWDRSGNREFATLRGHTAMITSIAWHPQKDLLLSSDFSGMIRIWDLHSFEATENWRVEASGIVLARWIDSDLVLTVGREAGCQVWKRQPGNHEPELVWTAPLGYPILSADLSQNRQDLVVTGSGGQVELLTISASDGVLAKQPIELPQNRSSRALVTFLPNAPKRENAFKSSPSEDTVPIDRAIEAAERSLLSARQTVKELEEQLSLLHQIKQSQQMEKSSP
jgi:WD40 repeat protein/mono/diheme cytochrome c family protein